MNNPLAPKLAAARVFFSFRVQERLYGIDVAHVREVSTQVALTPVSQAPPIVGGLVNLRSRIHLALDLGPVLGLAPSRCTPDSRLIVLQERVAENLGLLVERGGDIVRVAADQVESTPQSEAARSTAEPPPSAVAALCKLEGELMMVIDPARIIAVLEAAIR